LDFLTTPGYLTGKGAREAEGLPPDTGPYRVITDLGILGYHEETKRMEVLSIHPGVSLGQVQDATGFELGVRQPLGVTAVPTEAELEILRTEVDPHRYIIGR
jgi:glutaconate CoA-transferase subunit B